eukprot:3177571-Pleurochrysis_carterae.AAC.1
MKQQIQCHRRDVHLPAVEGFCRVVPCGPWDASAAESRRGQVGTGIGSCRQASAERTQMGLK